MSELISAVSVDQINSFFEKYFKVNGRTPPETTLMEYDHCVIEMACDDTMLRPGGFISGPVQMALADHAAYIAIFTRIGITPMALTSNLNIDFLRPCKGDKLIADAKVVKFGKALVVINVDIRGAASDKVSSQSVVTYALPKE